MPQLYLAMFAVYCLLTAYLSYAFAENQTESNCYRVPSEMCPKDGNHCGFHDLDTGSVQLYCCNITSDNDISNYLRNHSCKYECTIVFLHL